MNSSPRPGTIKFLSGTIDRENYRIANAEIDVLANDHALAYLLNGESSESLGVNVVPNNPGAIKSADGCGIHRVLVRSHGNRDFTYQPNHHVEVYEILAAPDELASDLRRAMRLRVRAIGQAIINVT